MIVLFPAFLAGWVLTLTLLIIFHLLFDNAPEDVRYALGAGAICVGCALAGFILDNPILTFGPAVITSAGLIIALIQHIEQRVKVHKDQAQKQGEIVGIARRLEQEIDRHVAGPDRQN